MKTYNILNLAIKGKRRSAALLVVVFTLACYFLLVSGSVFFALNEEKSQPCELMVTSESGITDEFIADINKIDTVLAASAIIEQPFDIAAGMYSAEGMTITGIDSTYFNESLETGTMFPEESIMPYVIVNRAALKLLRDDHGKEIDKNTVIDWLNEEVKISTEKPVISRICGIIEKDDDEPRAYMSLSSAKAFGGGYTGALVRILNSGYEKPVTNAIESMGGAVINSDAGRQIRWERINTEAIFLLISGLCVLVCSIMMLCALTDAELWRKKEHFDTLRLCGMSLKQISLQLTVVGAAEILAGLFIGTIAALVAPFFVPEEYEISVFKTLLSPWAFTSVVVVFIACMCIVRIVIIRMVKTALLGR